MKLDADQRRRLLALCKVTPDKVRHADPRFDNLWFRDSGVWAVDGYRIGYVDVKFDVPNELAVPTVRFAKALREATRKTDVVDVSFALQPDQRWCHVDVTRPHFELAGGRSRVTATERMVRVSIPLDDASDMPNIDKLLPPGWDAPSEQREGWLALSGALLAELAATAATESGARGVAVRRMDAGQELPPLEVRDLSGRFVGIQMPMRASWLND